MRMGRLATGPVRWFLAGAMFLGPFLVGSPASGQQSVSFQNAINAYDRYFGGERDLAVGDVNGDGIPDLAFAGAAGFYCYQSLGVLLGTGTGTFGTPSCFDPASTEALAVRFADMNGDGKLDLVAGSPCDTANNCATGNVGVLLGNGDGTFQPIISNTAGISAAGLGLMAVGDVNGDGIQDVVVSNAGSGDIEVLLGHGDGTLAPAIGYNTPYAVSGPSGTSDMSGGFMTGLALADIDGDGLADIALLSQCAANGNCGSGAFGFMLNLGGGVFQSSSPTDSFIGNTALIQAQLSSAMTLADFNGDGRPDVAVVSPGPSGGDGVVSILLTSPWLPTGTPTYSLGPTYDARGLGPIAISSADINRDGKPDLLVLSTLCPGCSDSSALAVFFGTGDGNFGYAFSNKTGPYGSAPLVVADLNRDGRPDVIANGSQVFVLLGEQAPPSVPLPRWSEMAEAAALLGIGLYLRRRITRPM